MPKINSQKKLFLSSISNLSLPTGEDLIGEVEIFDGVGEQRHARGAEADQRGEAGVGEQEEEAGSADKRVLEQVPGNGEGEAGPAGKVQQGFGWFALKIN